MRTITIDIINEKVLSLLRELELLKLIRLRGDMPVEKSENIDWTKFKGAMFKQPLAEVEEQLKDLRSEWE